MQNYKFHQDRKITTWERTHFSVNAENYAHALLKLEQYKEAEIEEDIDNNIIILENEMIYETLVQMTPSENKGFATIEIYNEKGENVSSNTTNNRDSIIVELSSSLAEKQMVDEYGILPHDFFDDNTEEYKEDFQKVFDSYYDKYYAIIGGLAK